MSAQSTIGETLERDHRAIDAHFAAFATALADDRVEPSELQQATEGLKHHIWVEEEYHFPPLRAAGLVGPIMVMHREHGELWDLLDLLDTEVAAGNNPAALRETWSRIEALLDAHNLKEEQILYPAGDAQLDAAAAEQVATAFTTGQRPSDWTCAMAGRG